MELEKLPGGELIAQGLRDAAAGRESAAAMLVRIARSRLARLGLRIPENGPADPDLELYRLLAAADPRRAHSRYNALVRRLVSFERAARSRV